MYTDKMKDSRHIQAAILMADKVFSLRSVSEVADYLDYDESDSNGIIQLVNIVCLVTHIAFSNSDF